MNTFSSPHTRARRTELSLALMAPTKTKKKPAPSGDAMDAPTVPAAAPVLSKEQQCFLQALLARGVIEVTKAEQMYRCVRARSIDRSSVVESWWTTPRCGCFFFRLRVVAFDLFAEMR
jgi:hypothetical protein